MAHFLRVVACALLFWAVGSDAETMPATPYSTAPHTLNWDGNAWDGPPAVGIAACAAWDVFQPTTSCTPVPSPFPNYACVCGSFGQQNYGAVSCPAGYTPHSEEPYCRKSGATCPEGQGWTLSGETCTRPDCGAGQVRNGQTGVCETPDPCPAGGSSTASRYVGTFNAGNGTDVGTATPVPGTLCDGQCLFTPSSVTGCSSGAAVGAPVQCGYSGPKTGAPCSGGNGPAPAYDPCILQGGVAGTLNGQPVCTNDGTGNNTVPGTTTASKTTTTPTSTTTTTTTTTCTGDGACSTTTTNQYTSGGSGPNGTGPGSTTVPGTGPGTPGAGVGESTEADSPGAFCKENPDSPLCVKGAWSGACGAQPACTGDAVQCAQAAEVFRVRCGLETEPTDAAYLLGKSIAGGGSDTVVSPMDPSQHVSVNVAERLAQAVNRPAAFSRTCFTAPSFTVMGQTYTVPVSQFCEFLAACGYMLVAASGVVGLRIVLS